MCDQFNEKALSSRLNKMYENYICLDKNEEKICVNEFNQVINTVRDALKKKNSLFNELFSGITYTGSYYDRVRVSEATEFDVNIILKLPMCLKNIKLDIRGIPPGFIKVNAKEEIKKLRQHPKWTDMYREMDSWFDTNGFLDEEMIRRWFESVLQVSLNDLKTTNPDIRNKVTFKKTGPAMTLVIKQSDQTKIDADLVPVIQFTHPQWPNPPVRQYKNGSKTDWYIVPKKKVSATKFYWRLAFPRQEREVFDKFNHTSMKKCVKLLKKLRDAQNWTFLASYYIKTIFLWEIEKKNFEDTFWKKSLGFIFMEMLQKLHACFMKKEILFYWNKECNLLQDASDTTNKNALNRLCKIIESLKKDAQSIDLYLVTTSDNIRRESRYSANSGNKNKNKISTEANAGNETINASCEDAKAKSCTLQ